MTEGRDYGQLKDLRQIKMETGQQVRMHVRNLLETAED